jgi:two-component system sensor histidine kinase PilS (NtrC family)
VGLARIALLIILTAGAQLIEGGARSGFGVLLTSIYVAAFASSIWYCIVLRKERQVSALLTWTQMLVDFGVVAATISFTQGQQSFFTFLLVVVILEAGVLMGLMQGFLFATLGSLFMMFQFALTSAQAVDVLTHWYNFLIQAIAFFFTAFISGYWHQRVSRMKQFQREILDNMNSGFLITDSKGIVIAINKAACTILGLDEPNVAGRHVDGILRPSSGAECPVTTAIRSNKDFSSYEFYADSGSGASLLLGLTTSRIRDLQDNVTGLIASFTDLTEMAEMRRELQQQDRLALVGELSAGLAHEIRNPLAAIRGAMDELRNNADNPKMAGRLTTIAIRESDHLNEIVTSFLDFARDPSRKRDPVDLRALALETRDHLLRKYDHPEELIIEVTAPDRPLVSLGDMTKLRQVFLNLAQNAVEAMHGSGRLDIVMEHDEGPIEVRFEDNGPGIDPDKVARIFEPFYTDKERGVGMGLAICMRIITAHDGTLQAASRPGGGTAMYVRLPAQTS